MTGRVDPGDEESRPAVEPDGNRNLIAGDDNPHGTAELAGADEKRWTDAELCYAITVHREGFLARLGEAGADAAATPEWRQVVRSPTFDELSSRRRSDPFRGRCTRQSCGERCAQCIRAAAIERNRARYGSNGDYPGADAAAAILRVRGAA